MFGYVTINSAELTADAKERYQAYYCGLCSALGKRYGAVGRTTLSNDMTFLWILLSALYEPDATERAGRCAVHPVRQKRYIDNEISSYIADMNIALSYHKSKDDWADENRAAGYVYARLLRGAYERIEQRYPRKCEVIASSLAELTKLERTEGTQVDAPANLTATMLGEVFAYREDYWEKPLRAMGEALGRFIYLMDAYEDLPTDRRKKNFNPLLGVSEAEDYEALCKDALMMLLAECTDAFEILPIIQDVDILRNILYAGVWTRYAAIQAKRTKQETKRETKREANG